MVRFSAPFRDQLDRSATGAQHRTGAREHVADPDLAAFERIFARLGDVAEHRNRAAAIGLHQHVDDRRLEDVRRAKTPCDFGTGLRRGHAGDADVAHRAERDRAVGTYLDDRSIVGRAIDHDRQDVARADLIRPVLRRGSLSRERGREGRRHGDRTQCQRACDFRQ
ncbi:hypothetical protein QP166_05910 [Sphingomonas sp. LR60]